MTNKWTAVKTISPIIKQISAKYDHKPESLLEIFQELQEQQIQLSPDLIDQTARALNIPPERAFGVATFYTMLAMDEIPDTEIRICDGPVCWLKGADKLRDKFNQINRSDQMKINRNSCLGLCDRAPAVLVNNQPAGPVLSGRISNLIGGDFGDPMDYSTPRDGELRVMLDNIGNIDPHSIDSAIEFGAYQGLRRALNSEPEWVINEISNSTLAGRGGAGFPTGRKWGFVRSAPKTPKYVIGNADESEPLIFKDRVLMETNPHQIIEGMTIAGYAVGSEQAFIYIRGEYQQQANILEHAIQQAEERNLLGDHILGTEFSFKIHIHRGAGAYICGEETALIESLEGKRGEPRTRPPYPPAYGYKGFPTLVNNVETFASVPNIIRRGADWYLNLSEYPTPGTKLFLILGSVNDPGIFEAPFGITIRQAINQFGGGMKLGSEFHFALTGGAAGTIVPESLLDEPIDHTSFKNDVSLGAGGILICDQNTNPTALLRELLWFFKVESCGKCTPCRIGTDKTFFMLDQFVNHGVKIDMDQLILLADILETASFCGLGQSAAIPVKTAIKYFPNAFGS